MSTQDDSSGYGVGRYGEGKYGHATDGGTSPAGRTPYNDSPHPIPGRIPAAEFDLGGEGVAYHETDERARWAVDDFRGDLPVDIKLCPDETAEYAIGRFLGGEWLAYTCAIEPGTHTLRAHVGTVLGGCQLAVRLGGEQLTTLDIPQQPDWMSYTTVETDVTISGDAREAVLRLSPTTDAVDVAWVEFELVEPLEPTPEPDPEPEVEHAGVTIDAGTATARVQVYGLPPADVTVETAGGLLEDPALVLGELPQCAGSTDDGDRCSRDADVDDGSLTCWQHDASDIPDNGWS